MAEPFRKTAATVKISATTSSGNTTIAGIKGSVVVHNPGTTWAYVSFGADNTLAAADTDYWVAPASSQALFVPTNISYVAAKMESGTATIGFTPGQGI